MDFSEKLLLLLLRNANDPLARRILRTLDYKEAESAFFSVADELFSLIDPLEELVPKERQLKILRPDSFEQKLKNPGSVP